MSEPQAESAPWWPHFVTFCERDCSPGARSSAFYQRIYADAWEVAYLAGQLAMRERCAKGLPRAVAIGIYGIDSLYAKGWNDAVARAEELLRALSPEEHRT